MGVRNNKVSVCPLGIDLETFRATRPAKIIRDEFGIGSSDIVIIYVGRLEQVKGVPSLLKVANSLSSRFENLKFLIVGDGPLRSRFEKHSNPQIILTGWRKDVANLLNASDIFVLPSISEGLPISILEAYAFTKPVIATNVGAVPDLVIDSETGLLLSPGNSKQLEEAIIQFVNNPEMARSMGISGKRNVEANFNWGYVVSKYEQIYSTLTNPRFHPNDI
jgi:glycosyltransferase involved in cell wall biosynthesis